MHLVGSLIQNLVAWEIWYDEIWCLEDWKIAYTEKNIKIPDKCINNNNFMRFNVFYKHLQKFVTKVLTSDMFWSLAKHILS